jgi:hypothetical protein
MFVVNFQSHPSREELRPCFADIARAMPNLALDRRKVSKPFRRATCAFHKQIPFAYTFRACSKILEKAPILGGRFVFASFYRSIGTLINSGF